MTDLNFAGKICVCVWDTAGLLELLDGVLQFIEQRTHKRSKNLQDKVQNTESKQPKISGSLCW
jgi:hypothetical protein